MDGLAVSEAEHLDLHMARSLDVALQIDCTVAERARGHGLRGLRHRSELLSTLDPAHADAAASSSRLHQQRIAYVGAGGLQPIECAGSETRTASKDGKSAGSSEFACALLVSPVPDSLGSRADPHQPCIDHRLCEIDAFGEKAVTRMHGVGAMITRCRQQPLHVEVALTRRRGSNSHGLVR